MNVDHLPLPLERAAQTFSDRTVEVLRDMLTTGRLRPGERLNEVELAGALGISRGPLREAIQHLSSEGLVTTVPNRGAYVRTYTIGELRDLYEVRIALETHAVRLVAKSIRAEGMDDIRRTLDHADRPHESDAAYPRDVDFHRLLITATGNGALLEAATEVHRQIDIARPRSGHEPAPADVGVAEHRIIFDHLADGRVERAVKALTTHLRSCLKEASLILEDDPDAS